MLGYYRVKVNVSVSLQVQLATSFEPGAVLQWSQLHLKYPACWNALHYAPGVVRQLVFMLVDAYIWCSCQCQGSVKLAEVCSEFNCAGAASALDEVCLGFPGIDHSVSCVVAAPVLRPQAPSH